MQQAQEFYQKHGGKTIILARFVPIVRTFAPVVAGIGDMPRKTFIMYNIIGGVLWGVSLPLIGYYIGSKVPGIEKFVEPVILGVVILSIAPAIIHLLRQDNFRAAAKQKLRRAFKAITTRP